MNNPIATLLRAVSGGSYGLLYILMTSAFFTVTVSACGVEETKTESGYDMLGAAFNEDRLSGQEADPDQFPFGNPEALRSAKQSVQNAGWALALMLVAAAAGISLIAANQSGLSIAAGAVALICAIAAKILLDSAASSVNATFIGIITAESEYGLWLIIAALLAGVGAGFGWHNSENSKPAGADYYSGSGYR